MASEMELVDRAMEMARECFEKGGLQYGQEVLEQVLRCEPDHAGALRLLGIYHHRCRRYAEAVPLFERAIRLEPDNPDNHNNLGLCRSCLGDVVGGIRDIRQSLSLNPRNAAHLNNLALQYRRLRDHDAAILNVQEALDLSPRNADMWCNLGGTLAEARRYSEAMSAYGKALEIDPEMPAAHVDLHYLLQQTGRYEESWSHYEHRFRHFSNLVFYVQKYDQSRRWTDPNTDLRGKTVLLYCEQGLGDAIQFVRYIRYISRQSRVVLHCSPSLQRLFEQNPSLGVDAFFTQPIVDLDPRELPPHDLHASVVSLPHLLSMKDIPSEVYLKAAQVNDLGQSHHLKVGVCWAGSPQHPNDTIRSCNLREFEVLGDLEGVWMFSLQKHLNRRVYVNDLTQVVDYTAGSEHMWSGGLEDAVGQAGDFADVANILAGLDVVASVDTSILHLAGALGVKAFGLLAYQADPRWGLPDQDNVWYPSVSLIRQTSHGDWSTVFADLRNKIRDLLPHQ